MIKGTIAILLLALSTSASAGTALEAHKEAFEKEAFLIATASNCRGVKDNPNFFDKTVNGIEKRLMLAGVPAKDAGQIANQIKSNLPIPQPMAKQFCVDMLKILKL